MNQSGVFMMFQGEPMETYWLDGRVGQPEFDLEAVFD